MHGPDVAFIGLGIMGLPMAGHLLHPARQVYVHSRTKAKAEPLLARGAKWSDTPADAARDAAIVFLCLPDTPDVEQVVLGDRGVLAGAQRGTVVVDHSTISPAATRRIAEAAAVKGIRFLDAPVSGGDVGARNATLSIMVGGDPDAFEMTREEFQRLGKTITHCGPSGAGQLTKIVNQILVTGNLMATCEALTFAKQNGLDADKTIAALAGGAAGSWQFANLGPRIVKGDFAPGFMIDLVVKDLRLVAEAVKESNLDLPGLSLVHHLFTEAQKTGHGREGTQALYKMVERLSRE